MAWRHRRRSAGFTFFLLIAVTHRPMPRTPGRGVEALLLAGGLVVWGSSFFSRSAGLPTRFSSPDLGGLASCGRARPPRRWSSPPSPSPLRPTARAIRAAVETTTYLLAQLFLRMWPYRPRFLATVTVSASGGTEDAPVAHAFRERVASLPRLPSFPASRSAAWSRPGRRGAGSRRRFLRACSPAGPSEWVARHWRRLQDGRGRLSLTALTDTHYDPFSRSTHAPSEDTGSTRQGHSSRTATMERFHDGGD